MTKKSSEAQVYSLKITLKGSKPPVWRRVYVSSDSTLADLHDIIQIVMDWDDSHLHEFKIAGKRFSARNMMGDDFYSDVEDEGKVPLSWAEKMQPEFSYVYDFGDYWEHQIHIEGIVPADTIINMPLPYCVKGKRASPPEDCGGIGGYDGILDALADPSNKKHKEILEWSGYFDPEYFDFQGVNRRIGEYFKSR